MKKVTLLSFALVALMISSNVMAQEGKFRASAGLALGTKSDVDTDTGNEKIGLGINLGVEYFINDEFSVAPSYTIFFPSDPFDLSAINIDARYYFSKDQMEVYGLVGYTSLKAKLDAGVFGSVSNTEGGLNLGVGANFGINDKLKFNTQAKYATAGDGQLVVNGGLLIAF